jgi:UDP-GlcNAc:undecaprenyl-phosphate GlcNAc-1-phosphate transferase
MPVELPTLLVTILLTAVMVEAWRRLAMPLGWLDKPTERKQHSGPIPVTGGVAMFLVFAAALSGSAIHYPDWHIAGWFMVALTLMVVTGMWDDRVGLSPSIRLVIQLLAALALCLGWAREDGTPAAIPFDFAGLPGWLDLPLTLLFIIGCTNAFNMTDGLDGLAGSLAAMALVGIVVVATMMEQHFTQEAGCLLIAIVLGFLAFNLRTPWRKRAAVFMGDAGSMMLGCAIAGLILHLSATVAMPPATGGAAAFPALVWLVALPVIETLSLMARRSCSGQSPMLADRRHLHHILLRCGVPASRIVLLLVPLAALFGCIGVAGMGLGLPPFWLALGLLVPGLLHTGFVLSRTPDFAGDALPALQVSANAAD